MRLTNRYAVATAAIEERPGRYLGYFENKFGSSWCSCMRTASLRLWCCTATSAGSRIASRTQAAWRMWETSTRRNGRL